MLDIMKYSPYVVYLPFLIALTQLRSMTKEKRFLFAAIILGLLGEQAMKIAKDTWTNNMPVVHIYTLIEFCLLISVFHFGKSNLISRRLYKGLMISFVLLGLANMFFYQGIWVWNSIIRSLEGIILIGFSLYFFLVLLRDLEFLHPERTFMFWFSIAILIFFSGNLLLFIYSNHLTSIASKSDDAFEVTQQIMFINYILNIFLYLFYSIAFLCKESKTIPKSSWSAP